MKWPFTNIAEVEMLTRTSKYWGYLLLMGILISSCSPPEPIRIGFVADLTGANAALGVDGRDGAMLAVDRINGEGGVNERPIELVVRDDLGTSEGAIAVDGELINDEKLFVIVGHMTSGTMMAAWEPFRNSGVIFLSPTVSTPQLKGLEDNFFRLIPVNSFVAEKLASYAADELALKKVAVFYDTDNAAFTDTYREGFSNAFSRLGGEIVLEHAFSSQTGPDFKPVLNGLKDKSPDGLFIAASAFDTALIAQQARLEGLDVKLLATNWALTDDLIENGGAAVDGIVTVVSHDENNQSVSHLDFEERFIERYGRSPSFAAGYGYEAILVLANALKKTNGEKNGLADALLETRDFPGVNGYISFDPYGDVSRTLYLIVVRDGKFLTIRDFPAP
jgi:branched-chain amino acid transport system substrate-binding protein